VRSAAFADRAYKASSILTAPPGRLVVMLYDGALRFLRQTARAMEEGRLEQARQSMRRAEAIIDELSLSLDLEQGEIAERLRAFYLFCKRELRRASRERDARPIAPLIELLLELREAWAAVDAGSAA
jgi:flagellar protein FliS